MRCIGPRVCSARQGDAKQSISTLAGIKGRAKFGQRPPTSSQDVAVPLGAGCHGAQTGVVRRGGMKYRIASVGMIRPALILCRAIHGSLCDISRRIVPAELPALEGELFFASRPQLATGAGLSGQEFARRFKPSPAFARSYRREVCPVETDQAARKGKQNRTGYTLRPSCRL